MTKDNINAYINFLKVTGTPFTMKKSNYTCSIIHNNKMARFLSTYQSNRCFAAFSKIKKDVNALKVPKINYNRVRYFVHNFRKDSFHPEVINIDLKSAYATVLYNYKIISEDTFAYLKTLPKKDRLVSVGMLASKHVLFQYDNKGRLYNCQQFVSEYEPFFLFAVQKVFEIMTTLKNICEQNYLFTWVDGIYLKPDLEKLEKCIQYLDGINFPYSVDTLTNFNVKMVSTFVKVNFDKGGENKVFKIPIKDNIISNVHTSFDEFLNNKKQNNETSKIKSPPWQ